MADNTKQDTANNLTEKDVEQTKATTPTDVAEISKIHVYRTDEGQWQVELEYKDTEGNVSSGDTQSFDEFSQASAWVASQEVDLANGTGMQAPTVDDTTKL
jgi:hypothetical protein